MIGVAEAQQLTVVSAASPYISVATDSLAAIFGDSISGQTLAASSLPWPTMLGDIPSVAITDSTGQTETVGILFISPLQMNIYVPPTVAPGFATISFSSTGQPSGAGPPAIRQAAVNIEETAPALFTMRGTGMGVAAATAVRVTGPAQMQTNVPVFVCTGAGSCNPVAISIGVDGPVYISLFGTGIRNASRVTVTIGELTIQPTYAGPQVYYPGVDQVNFLLPFSLHGRGLVYVTVTADGKRSNNVQLAVQ